MFVIAIMKNKAFFHIIQVAIGQRCQLDNSLKEEEWAWVMEMATKHAIMGLVADAIEKLPENQRPPTPLRLECASQTVKTEKCNIHTFRDCVAITKIFEKRGFKCCILKGQGNALSYNNPLRRQSGDIDLWLDGGREKVIGFVKSQKNSIEARIHHVEYSEKGVSTSVELHYVPMFLYSFISQYRFEKFCKKEMERQMCHLVNIDKSLLGTDKDGDYRFAVPTPDFNAVFQMVHIMRHLFEEGIGLRQLIDYYHVIRQLPKEDHEKVMRVLRELGLKRFAASLMYVLEKVCGINEELMICPKDNQCGELLLYEIMMAGNFGIEDNRLGEWRHKSLFHMFIWKLNNNMKYWKLCPSEVVWGPAFRIWHFCWRKCKGYV